MFKLTTRYLALFAITFFILLSCNKSSQTPSGIVRLDVQHKVNGSTLELNKLMYTNAAGNQYLVTEVQWFVSKVKLQKSDGSTFVLKNGEPIYFDTGIPATLSQSFDKVPAGSYTGISFIFGLDETQNKSLRFTNPPESFMFWPDYLGGGYHYMKLNGKWLNLNGLLEPFNFHLGIGQIYDTIAPKSAWVNMNDCCKSARHCEGYQPPQKTMPITGFVQNYFEVSLPLAFTIEENKTQSLNLQMNIEQWFKEPHLYDHNHWGGSIMQQQAAMKAGCDNGHNVFTFSIPR